MGGYDTPFLLAILGQVLVMIDSIDCGLEKVIKKCTESQIRVRINSVFKV